MLQRPLAVKMRLQLTLKRVLDVVGSTVLLGLSAPIMAVVAALVKLSSPGPVIFCQTRAGLDGKPFIIYKFRTMVAGTETMGDGSGEAKADPRITRFGSFLRTYSLDELPQLWNALKGEMSLVGPRPTLPHQLAMYSERQLRRLCVRPGITGLAQVNGRNQLLWRDRIEIDLEYIDRWSLGLDLVILWRTLGAVISHRGMRHDRSGDEDEQF